MSQRPTVKESLTVGRSISMTEETPQPCPKCGESVHLRTSKWWDNHPNGEHWNTWCCFCGHEAARAEDKRTAVENWNNEAKDAALQQLADDGQQMGLWVYPVAYRHD